jgi:hypothetical protein
LSRTQVKFSKLCYFRSRRELKHNYKTEDKDEMKADKIIVTSDIATIMHRLEGQHEIMMNKSKKVLEELQQRDKSNPSKRKQFQEKRRITKINELAQSKR